MSEEWTEKYRPAKLSEVVGNDNAISELRAWAEAIGSAEVKAKKAAILHGPPGCGKTSAAYALASDMGWEVIELNASDQRNDKEHSGSCLPEQHVQQKDATDHP